jgi:hypothetical protein
VQTMNTPSKYNIELTVEGWLRNKSWKPECVLSFNMGWRKLVFYPDP